MSTAVAPEKTDKPVDILTWAEMQKLNPSLAVTVAPSPAELIAKGWLVRIFHQRRWAAPAQRITGSSSYIRKLNREVTVRLEPLPTGGFTSVALWAPGRHADQAPTAVATAKCSTRDYYNKKQGVAICIRRALRSLLPENR